MSGSRPNRTLVQPGSRSGTFLDNTTEGGELGHSAQFPEIPSRFANYFPFHAIFSWTKGSFAIQLWTKVV
jgi:hypothetical protein